MSDNASEPTGQGKLILATLCGAIALAVIELAVDDWKSWADANEKEVCKDRGDTKAMMARLPGEAHSVESCVQFIRFGDPRWVPDFGNPLPPDKMKSLKEGK